VTVSPDLRSAEIPSPGQTPSAGSPTPGPGQTASPGEDLSLADAERRRGLRRMKVIATSLLLSAAVVYALTLREPGAWVWVNVTAEAAMVGALADWFAVTALFRHPLGLPVPHTAIIPKRKDALGMSLQAFVSEHFLAEDVVRDKVARADVAGRAGEWLSRPANARLTTRLLARGVAGGLRELREEDLTAVLDQAVVQRVLAQEWSAPAGSLLEHIVAEGGHRQLADLAFDHLHRWVADNRPVIVGLVVDRAPAWTPAWVNEAIAARAFKEALALARDIDVDPGHRARRALDDVIARFAHDLQHDPETRAKAEDTMKKVLVQPEVRQALAAVWSTGRQLLVEALEDDGSTLRHRAAEALIGWGKRLSDDAELRARADAAAVDAVGFLVRTYREEISTIISDTVRRWDGVDASRRIELHVGRDLQFIRINGTVVGALAGLAIHAVTVLAG